MNAFFLKILLIGVFQWFAGLGSSLAGFRGVQASSQLSQMSNT